MSSASCVRTLLLCALFPLGCSGQPQSLCEDTCAQIQSCTGGTSQGATASLGWYCPHTAACGERASCEAECILEAPCAVVKGSDATGLDSLRQCLATCAGGKVDTPAPPPPVKADGGGQTPDSAPSCQAQCEGKRCGPDGCGGQCGTCPDIYQCDLNLFQCMPKTPPQCYDFNECKYEGQKVCTTDTKYRECKKGYNGCLVWDCAT